MQQMFAYVAHEADPLIEDSIVSCFGFAALQVQFGLTAKPACGLCAVRYADCVATRNGRRMSGMEPREQVSKPDAQTRKTPDRWSLRLLTTVQRTLKQVNSTQAPRASSTTSSHCNLRAKWQQAGQRRRALEHEGGPGFTNKNFEGLCKQYGERCLCCGRKLPLVADHVVPLSKGGKHSIDNIQPLCRECNSRKHTLTVDFRKEENRFSFFVGKASKRRHFLRPGQLRTLCGLQAYEPIGFSEIIDELSLCRKCVWSLRGELERLQAEQTNGQSA